MMSSDLIDPRQPLFPFRPDSAGGPTSLPGGTLTHARDDDELIALWLRRPNLAPGTVRANRKEAERFLCWCRAGGLGLRDVRYEDLLGYAHFITDPQPAAQWVSTAKRRRDDPRWRPFGGPLSDASQRQAITIIKGLFAWARAADYLASDPARLLGGVRLTRFEGVSRFLPPVAILLMLQAADRMPAGRPAEALRRARARFLVTAFYLTATRLGELAGADMGSIRRDDGGLWWLHVIGKGNRAGKVPAPADLVAEFQRYRVAFGLAPLPTPRDDTPLVLTTRGPLRRATDHAIARAVKSVMADAAGLALAAGLREVADRIGQASTHWLRHSALTHQVDANVPLKSVQRNARHASLTTTGRYVHREDAARHAETIASIAIGPAPGG